MPSTTPSTHPMPQVRGSSKQACRRSAFYLPKANSQFNRKPTVSGLIPALTPGNHCLKLTPTTCTRSMSSHSQLSLSQFNRWLIYPFSTLIQPVPTHTTLNQPKYPLRPPLCDLPTDDSPWQRQRRYQPTPKVERTSGTSLFLWKKPCPGLICPDLWGELTAQCSGPHQTEHVVSGPPVLGGNNRAAETRTLAGLLRVSSTASAGTHPYQRQNCGQFGVSPEIFFVDASSTQAKPFVLKDLNRLRRSVVTSVITPSLVTPQAYIKSMPQPRYNFAACGAAQIPVWTTVCAASRF